MPPSSNPRSAPKQPPPKWSPDPQQSIQHALGLKNNAPQEECHSAEIFCERNPVEDPRLISSHIADRIRAFGPRVWGIETPRLARFRGEIVNAEDVEGDRTVTTVTTRQGCGDTCLMSNLPLVSGLYEIPQGKEGAYYEVNIGEMTDKGFVAIGTACRPYPNYRLPGWNRLSAGLHLDDMRKFFEDNTGGRDYVPNIQACSGDTFGCGYEYHNGHLFFTHNGRRLPNAFEGIYLPRTKYDVYAAIGVSDAVQIEINFGGKDFMWFEGNRWMSIQQVGGSLADPQVGDRESLPRYSLH
ncbi:hypothetical protein H0H92_011132 [Tricholoma furcatifolium]|nr:hypothetical protein H0H92_011132 [Tricholoma furcatifolium]